MSHVDAATSKRRLLLLVEKLRSLPPNRFDYSHWAGDDWAASGMTRAGCHRMRNTDDPVAFLRCTLCGLEHTIGTRIGRTSNRQRGCGGFWWRLDGSDWRKYPKPSPCRGARRALADRFCDPFELPRILA